MIILLTVIAIVIAGVPLAAVVLVTVASRHEENAGSIGGCAPGRIERAARRLLAFHAIGIDRPAYRGRGRRPRRGPGRSADDDRHRTGLSYRSGPTHHEHQTNRTGPNGGPGRRGLVGAALTGPRRRP